MKAKITEVRRFDTMKELNEAIENAKGGETFFLDEKEDESYIQGFKQGIKRAEQFKKELDELQEAYDIAMKEIARLRAKLYGESKC